MGPEIVGERIQVFWIDDDAWYSGKVEAYREDLQKHQGWLMEGTLSLCDGELRR